MEMLAAVDGTRFSSEVLDTAARIATIVSVGIEAVNAHADDSTAAARAAREAGVTFRLLFGDAATAILRPSTTTRCCWPSSAPGGPGRWAT